MANDENAEEGLGSRRRQSGRQLLRASSSQHFLQEAPAPPPSRAPLSPAPSTLNESQMSSAHASDSSPGFPYVCIPSPSGTMQAPNSADDHPFLLSTRRPGLQLLDTPTTISPAQSFDINIIRPLWPINELSLDNAHIAFPPPPPPSPAPCDSQPRSPAVSVASNFSERPLNFGSSRTSLTFYEHLLGEDALARPPPLAHNDTTSRNETHDDDDEDEEPDPEVPAGPNAPDLDPLADEDQPNPYPEPEPEGPDDPDDNELSAAFLEHPRLRNIYIRTYIRAAFARATAEDIHAILESHRLALEAAAEDGELPEAILEDLPKMPRTLRALQRRLGADLDDHLQIFTLCTSCGKRYSSDYVNAAMGPRCMRYIGDELCGNHLYSESILYGGVRKRKPFKSFPYLSPITAIERLLLRPGMKEILQHWRGEGDEPGVHPPSTRRDWVNNTPEDVLFGDITTASTWRTTQVGMKRSYNLQDGMYGDEEPAGGPRSLTCLPLGLSLAMNFDG